MKKTKTVSETFYAIVNQEGKVAVGNDCHWFTGWKDPNDVRGMGQWILGAHGESKEALETQIGYNREEFPEGSYRITKVQKVVTVVFSEKEDSE